VPPLVFPDRCLYVHMYVHTSFACTKESASSERENIFEWGHRRRTARLGWRYLQIRKSRGLTGSRLGQLEGRIAGLSFLRGGVAGKSSPRIGGFSSAGLERETGDESSLRAADACHYRRRRSAAKRNIATRWERFKRHTLALTILQYYRALATSRFSKTKNRP
jgi:hypothetical protein